VKVVLAGSLLKLEDLVRADILVGQAKVEFLVVVGKVVIQVLVGKVAIAQQADIVGSVVLAPIVAIVEHLGRVDTVG